MGLKLNYFDYNVENFKLKSPYDPKFNKYLSMKYCVILLSFGYLLD